MPENMPDSPDAAVARGRPALGEDYLSLPDERLAAQCDVNIHRASGPGGQHRNKVSTAVRLLHRPTGVSATAYDSRSQQTNRRQALARLRMHIACRQRRPVDPAAALPEVVQSCLFAARGGPRKGARRLEVGRKDRRFWQVGQYLLDVLAAREGRLAESAEAMGISTGNFVSLLKQDRHLLAAAQDIRKDFGAGPIN